jgi:hypothetical protein
LLAGAVWSILEEAGLPGQKKQPVAFKWHLWP